MDQARVSCLALSYFIDLPVWALKLVIDSPVKFWCGTRILLNDKAGCSKSLMKMTLRLFKSVASKMLSKNNEHVESEVYRMYKCILTVCVRTALLLYSKMLCAGV